MSLCMNTTSYTRIYWPPYHRNTERIRMGPIQRLDHHKLPASVASRKPLENSPAFLTCDLLH